MLRLAFAEEYAIKPNEGGQELFSLDWTHFIVGLEGGWYSGKTFIGARKLLALHEFNAFEWNCEDEVKRPTYVASLIVAPTYSNAMDFCVPHFEDACEECNLKYHWHGTGGIAGGRFYGPAIIIDDFGTKKKPSVILIRSADVPKRITGFTVGAAWGDEAPRWKEDRLDPKNDAFIQLTGRVRDLRAMLLQILLTYTNEGDTTRTYEEMHSGKEDRRLYRAPTSENPAAKEFIQRQLLILTKELAQQYLEGKAVNLRGGKVYGDFDFDLNVDAKVTIDRARPLQLSLDFNIVPGMHAEVGQHHESLDLFTTFYEIHAPRLDVRSMLDRFIQYTKDIQWEWNVPLEIFGDATGRSEWAGTGDSCYTIVQQKLKAQDIPYRVRVPRANPRVIDRINAVNCALCDVSGKIHYLIHPCCERLIDDYKKMQRDKYGEIDKTDRKLSHPSDADGYRIEFIRPVRIETIGVGGQINV